MFCTYLTKMLMNKNMYIVKLQVLTRVSNMEINFFPKGHNKSISNFPFIDNLKKPVSASKWDGLVLPTLRYLKTPSQITSTHCIGEARTNKLAHKSNHSISISALVIRFWWQEIYWEKSNRKKGQKPSKLLIGF